MVQVPYRLSWTVEIDGSRDFQPGRGEAGWTVGSFDSSGEALAFMGAHPEAAMPCWPRLLAELIASLGAR
jgi:hypothetical protein